MTMRKYTITGRGSVTRWEHADGKPCRGTTPPDAVLVRHEKTENPDLILEESVAQDPKNGHFKFVPFIAGSVTTKAPAPAPAPAPAAAKPAEPAAKQKAQAPAGDANVTNNVG